MSVLLLPQGTIDAIDRRRRSFLWTGEDRAHGAQCLVAWENVCQPKEQGGLGIKNLPAQSKCLLLKMLHRMYHPGESAWTAWVRGKIDLATMAGDVAGAHWQDFGGLLPLYRAVTVSEVRNECSTNFWKDRWLSAGRLSDLFPLLFSHTTCLEASVARAMERGVRRILLPRLSHAASEELLKMDDLLAVVSLTADDDHRSSRLSLHGEALGAALFYKALLAATRNAPCTYADFVWKNRAPPRVQFFAWLLVQGRVQCRANLLVKNIVDDSSCELCWGAAEDSDHIILRCPFALQVWTTLSIDMVSIDVSHIWDAPRPSRIPPRHFDSFLLLVSWHLWKHRNSVVFEREAPPHARFWTACKQDPRLWSCRWPAHERLVADAWCASFSPM
jgi:hypothetical protein